MLVEIDKNARIVKDDMHFIVYLEVWRAIDELGELWNVEYTLEEESYMKYVELRSIDPGYKVLQIFAVPLESQPGKGGEESACPMSTSVPGRPVMILRARVFEFKDKVFEPGRSGEGSDHRFGWDVSESRIGNIMETEIDEMSGR